MADQDVAQIKRIEGKDIEQFLPWTGLTSRLPEMKAQYQSAHPFNHIAIDDFLHPEVAEEILQAFPGVESEGWTHYVHFNENKHGLNKFDRLPDAFQQLIHQLHSEAFLNWLSELTGIPGMIEDYSLEGGGIHQTLSGGFLNVHADFRAHPHHLNWMRRANLLIYFNKDWKEEYGGLLELWTRDMKECAQSIMPNFNRCVIFTTDDTSYHGYPEKTQFPEDISRKSLALYYFTKEKKAFNRKSTDYRARPEDSDSKAFKIWLDKTGVAMYSRVKGILGIDDNFASKILNLFNKKK